MHHLHFPFVVIVNKFFFASGETVNTYTAFLYVCVPGGQPFQFIVIVNEYFWSGKTVNMLTAFNAYVRTPGLCRPSFCQRGGRLPREKDGRRYPFLVAFRTMKEAFEGGNYASIRFFFIIVLTAAFFSWYGLLGEFCSTRSQTVP